MILLIIFIATTIIVFIEQKRYQDAGYSASPILMAAGVALLWIAIFPYYILKVKRPLRESVVEDGGQPQEVISEKVSWIIYAIGIALFLIDLLVNRPFG
jgi:hypothetical protein